MQVISETNTYTIYMSLKSTIFLGHFMPQSLYGVVGSVQI